MEYISVSQIVLVAIFALGIAVIAAWRRRRRNSKTEDNAGNLYPMW